MVNTYLGEWSLGKSLLLKSGMLGMSLVAVLWVGWPQPHMPYQDHASSVPAFQQLAARPLSSIPEMGASAGAASVLSSGDMKEQNLGALDQVLLIDLNVGSRRELESLPGIGRKLADRIVSYRSIHGTFQHINELEKVSGIGKKRLRRLEPFVTVSAKIEKRAS